MNRQTMEVASRLRLSLSRLTRRMRLEAREPGLSVAKHTILALLAREGAKTPGALAHAEGVQPQSMTRVLAELEEEELTLRKQDTADKRQFNVEITARGRDLIDRDAQNRALWLASAINARLSPIEQELLRLTIDLIDKLVETPASDLPAVPGDKK